MVKDKKKDIEEKPKKSGFQAFLKKRAPFYLAGIVLIVISAQGMFSEKNLENSLPSLSEGDNEVVQFLMNYNGNDDSKMSVKQVITDKLNEKYKNENIFENKKTSIDLVVTNVQNSEYNIILDINTFDSDFSFDWNVNLDENTVVSNNQDAKKILDVVAYS